MRTHKLVRFDANGDGTFGRFEHWISLEEEDQNNQRMISSIPPGVYVCERTWYHGGGYETFEVTDVPGRDRILFHVANTEEDLAGCIGLGLSLGVLKVVDEDTGHMIHKLAVLRSRTAFKQFMEFFKGVDKWTLVIEEYKA